MDEVTTNASFHHVPAETWLQILSVVACHPTKDEFATKTHTHHGFSRRGDNLNTDMNQRELSKVIKQRLTLALVCRSWHGIAIPHLWSHVRLRLNTPHQSLDAVLEAIERKPYLASLTKRLTIHVQTAPHKGRKEREDLNEFNIRRLLRTLPNLKLISYPSTYQLTELLTGVEVISIGSGRHIRTPNSKEHFFGPQSVSLQARMLSMDLDNMCIRSERPASFPRLETLHLTLIYHYGSLHSLARWSMPHLRWLSLKSESPLSCLIALLPAQSTLQYLQIDLDIQSVDGSQVTLLFPCLTSIFLSFAHRPPRGESALRTLIHLVNAPQLRCFGFFDLQSSYHLISSVNMAIEAYPSLDTICLEGSIKLVHKSGLLSEEDVMKWCGRGLRVKVRSGVPWVTYGAQGDSTLLLIQSESGSL